MSKRRKRSRPKPVALQPTTQPTRGGPCINIRRVAGREVACRTKDGELTLVWEPNVICDRCIQQLDKWLLEIPDLQALLPEVVTSGSVARNPDSRGGRGVDAPAPVRLEVVDLLDDRPAGASDHRGTLGVLLPIAEEIVDKRNLEHGATTVYAAAALIRRNLTWLTTQPWVVDAWAELKPLHRALADAIGDYRPAVVGRCLSCGGNLQAQADGMDCSRCGSRIDYRLVRDNWKYLIW